MIEWLVRTHKVILTWSLWLSVILSGLTGATIASWIEIVTRSYNSEPNRHGLFLILGFAIGAIWGFITLAALIGHMLTLSQMLTVVERIEKMGRSIESTRSDSTKHAVDSSNPMMPTTKVTTTSGDWKLDDHAVDSSDPVIPATKVTPISGDLKVDDKVSHQFYGNGTVVQIVNTERVLVRFSGRDQNQEVTVRSLRRGWIGG
jgi:hypothetical protein